MTKRKYTPQEIDMMSQAIGRVHICNSEQLVRMKTLEMHIANGSDPVETADYYNRKADKKRAETDAYNRAQDAWWAEQPWYKRINRYSD